MKVLILAGGFATRLWPLTERRAKPLLLLDGKTILAHILEKIPREEEVILLTNAKFEKDFELELKKIGRSDAQIFLEDSHSDGEKLGALGAISKCIKDQKIDKNILIFAGDNLLPELNTKDLLCEDGEAKIAIREVEDLYDAQKFGVVELENQSESGFRVRNFQEKPENPRSKWVSTGFMSVGRELFSILHDFAKRSPDNLGAVFTEFLAHKKKVFATKVGGEWFDIGSFETYLDAHRKLHGNVKKSEINSNNTFSGKVFVGEGAKLTNCLVTDSIIYPGCRLHDCHISQSVIDGGCVLEGLDLNRKLVRRGTRMK